MEVGYFRDYESFILYSCRPAVVRRSGGERRERGGEREAIGARAFSVLAGDCERRRGVSATRWRRIATDPHHHSSLLKRPVIACPLWVFGRGVHQVCAFEGVGGGETDRQTE